ncbi:hypothetical protein JCM8208_002706 [Rhodotorula glutinis]
MHPASPHNPSPGSPSSLAPAPPRDHDNSDAGPPTYAQSQAVSPSSQRFTRWGDWLDKRARERERPDPSSSSSSSTNSPSLVPRPLEPHQDHLPLLSINDTTRPRSTSAASSTTGPRSTLRLSRTSLLDRLGSRFDRGIPDEPLCAASLQTSHTHDDRLVLVGTAKGLYLVDLAPVSASAPLSTSARSPADARTYCLWNGIGVHHVEVHVDALDRTEAATGARTPPPSGCVVALIGGEHDRQVRTWSLERLVNLATWRAMDEHSVPLELEAAHFSSGSARTRHEHHHHQHHPSSSASSTASPTASGRHPSFPFLHKSTHHSPAKDAQAPASSSSSSSTAASASTSRASLHPLDVAPAPAHGSPSPPPPSGSTTSSTSPSPSRTSAHLEQPLGCATSCTALAVPKGAGTVVSCRLFRMPPPPTSSSASSSSPWVSSSRSDGPGDGSYSSDDGDSDGYDDEPSARVRAERERRRAEAGRVLLVVVGSSRSVFVYELGPGPGPRTSGREGAGGGRSWMLTREFFAPSTPRFLNLVRTTSPPSPTLPPLRATTSHPPPTSSYTPTVAGPAYAPDLHLVLGTSHRVVLVSLATSAVHEVDVPLEGTRPTTTKRRRAGSAASSRSEPVQGFTAGGSSALGLGLGHRKTPSRAAAAAATAALGLGELRKSLSALVGGGGARGGGGAVPAGMDEREVEGLVAGRRVGEGRHGGREGDKEWERERTRWTGCDVVALPGRGSSRSGRHSTSPTRTGTSTLILLTRGSTSYLVPSLPCPAPLGAPDPPLGLDRSPSRSSSPTSPSSGAPDPLALDVRHTFHHALGPVRRVVALAPPSSSSSALSGAGGESRPLVVCAFAETGLAVQEWSVSPRSGLVAPLEAPVVGREARQQEVDGVRAAEKDDDEDDPLPGAATLDFARATRFLCVLGGAGSGAGSSAATGALFAVEGRGGWELQRLGVSM